jgi:uncharacterized membrane protein YdjX (TVP38/TMEM64 family)
MQTRPRAYLLVAALLLLAAIARLVGLDHMVGLDGVIAARAELKAWTVAHPVPAVLIFAGLYITAVALSLPFGTLLSLLGGFLFGVWLGTAVIVGSATIGAVAVFWIARSSLGATLRDRAGPLYRRIEREMRRNAFSYILFMRLVPLFPFVLVNIVPALFNVPTRTYVAATLMGIVPGAVLFAQLGQELSEAMSLADLVSTSTLVTLSLLGLVALAPALYRRLSGPSDPLAEP